jgi:hypothetical protein
MLSAMQAAWPSHLPAWTPSVASDVTPPPWMTAWEFEFRVWVAEPPPKQLLIVNRSSSLVVALGCSMAPHIGVVHLS